ncbi:MAG TPA: EamA family transporter [Mycobacteriales bacterium]|nr:EamA family transporter [Mycobacteriales bacterium]
MTRPSPPSWQVWTALWLVYVVWGSTYLAIAYVVDTVPPLVGMGLRFVTAALLVAAYVAVRRGPAALRVSRRQLRSAAVVGLLLLLGGNGGVALAESADLPSGLAALLVAVIPLQVVLLRWLARDRPSAQTVAGVGLGFVGLAVLLLPGARPEGVALVAVLTVVAGAFLWSLGSFYATRAELPADGLTTTAVEMACGGVALLVVGVLRGERVDVEAVSTSSLVALGYLVVFGSIVAFTAYSWLLSVAPVSQVATYAYVNPVVAVALGAVLRGEDVTRLTVLGGAITIVAVAVVVREEGRRRARPAEVDLREPQAVPS